MRSLFEDNRGSLCHGGFAARTNGGTAPKRPKNPGKTGRPGHRPRPGLGAPGPVSLDPQPPPVGDAILRLPLRY